VDGRDKPGHDAEENAPRSSVIVRQGGFADPRLAMHDGGVLVVKTSRNHRMGHLLVCDFDGGPRSGGAME
jgi:hypothetical protein